MRRIPPPILMAGQGVISLTRRDRLYRLVNSQAFVALLFLAVPVLLLAALKIYPVFYNLYLSFTRYELFEPPRFVGMKNYKAATSMSRTCDRGSMHVWFERR